MAELRSEQMAIENVEDAVRVATSRLTLESVLSDVAWMANQGRRSNVYTWLPDDLRAELQRRGFRIQEHDGGVVLQW